MFYMYALYQWWATLILTAPELNYFIHTKGMAPWSCYSAFFVVLTLEAVCVYQLITINHQNTPQTFCQVLTFIWRIINSQIILFHFLKLSTLYNIDFFNNEVSTHRYKSATYNETTMIFNAFYLFLIHVVNIYTTCTCATCIVLTNSLTIFSMWHLSRLSCQITKHSKATRTTQMYMADIISLSIPQHW